MPNLKTFIGLTMMGGLAVVLPVLLMLVIFQWLFGLTRGFFEPITSILTSHTGISELLAMLLVIGCFFAVCFFIGLLLRTTIGGWLHSQIDKWLAKLAPGYKTIREVVSQLLGGSGEASLLNGVPALAKIYGPDSPVSVTSIITSRHADGGFTVFVPTAPIPTSGITYHLPGDCVEILEGVTVEEAMRTVISCGTGSAELLGKSI